MKQQLKNNIILLSIFGGYVVLAVLEIVGAHTFRLLIWLGVMVALLVIGIPLSKWARDFKKIVDNLPADHKLVTRNIAAIDVGNIRFIYRVYEKGSGMSPVSKSYISMEVGIPFPLSGRESIKLDLKNLIINLKDEGGYPILEDDADTDEENGIKTTWMGQPLQLEFLQRTMTPSRMAEIQESIISIVDKYMLQDVSWCTIRGKEYATEYRYCKGNLLQSIVWVNGTYDRTRSDYKAIADLWTTEFEDQFSVDKYFELYESSSRNFGKDDLHLRDIKKLTRLLFKGKKNRIVRFAENSDDISVTVTIPKQRAASTYHLIHSNDRWWVFAEGRLEVINPVSTDDESSACDLFLRILNRIAESE